MVCRLKSQYALNAAELTTTEAVMSIDKENVREAIEHQIEITLNELDQIEAHKREEMDKLILLQKQVCCDHTFVLDKPRTDFIPYDACNCSKCGYTTYI